MGPTASGKSDLAERLANVIDLEIINVDSTLVYRNMDIGTAKPSRLLQEKIPHHLIDIRDPRDAYSAAEFAKDASQLITEIFTRHRLPVLVGGTMLYFKALLQGLSALPSSDPKVREELEQTLQKHGLPALHQRLQEIDPDAAKKIHPNDPQRTLRALEVYTMTGKKLSELQGQRASVLSDLSVCNIALMPASRELLHQRIEQRFHIMLQQGFLEEVSALYQRKDLNEQLPAIRAVGYRQAWQYLQGHISYEAMIEQAITATRQLAKRQLTWLRAWPEVHWLDSDDPALLEKTLERISIFSQTD